MQGLNVVQKIAVWAIPVIFAITLHEVAHGLVAYRLGDPTAKMLGRLTLNPLRHVDPIGTVLLPLGMLLFSGGFVFGWAKPVPIGVRNLKHPRRDMAIVGAAGPGSNFLMAIFWALVLRLGVVLGAGGSPTGVWLFNVGLAGVSINTVLMVFNLLPLPPLDGGRVASSLMPLAWSRVYDRIEPLGFMILIAIFGLLYLTGTLGLVFGTVLDPFLRFFSVFAGVPLG